MFRWGSVEGPEARDEGLFQTKSERAGRNGFIPHRSDGIVRMGVSDEVGKRRSKLESLTNQPGKEPMRDHFELTIFGDDVSPKSVDLRALLNILGGFEKAVSATGGKLAREGDPVSVNLVDVEAGSLKVIFVASLAAHLAIAKIETALNTGNFDPLPVPAHKGLREIWRTVSENGWEGCRWSNSEGVSSAEILASEELFPPKQIYTGRTTIYGECRKPGGIKKMSVWLILLDGTRRTVQLKDESLARALGKRMFQVIGLSGVAKWDADTDELIEFTADEVTGFDDHEGDHQRTSVREAFSQLAEISGSKWDDVDPDEYVRNLRRD